MFRQLVFAVFLSLIRFVHSHLILKSSFFYVPESRNIENAFGTFCLSIYHFDNRLMR